MSNDEAGANLLESVRSDLTAGVLLLVSAVFLAGAVNYATNILFQWLWPPYDRFWQIVETIVVGFLVVIFLMLALRALSAAPRSRSVTVRLLIPYIVGSQDVRIPYLHAYHPSRLASAALARFWRSSQESRRQFQTAIAEARASGGVPVQGAAVRVTYDLAELLLVHTLSHQARDSLTAQAAFLTGSPVNPHLLPARQQPLVQAAALHGNAVIATDPSFAERHLILPRAVSLRRSAPPAGADSHREAVRREGFVLDSRFGSLRIEFAPYVVGVASHRRTGIILRERVTVARREQLVATMVVVAMRLHIRLLPMLLLPRQAEAHCLWLNRLLDSIVARLDWDMFLATDSERTVVQMQRTLNAMAERVGGADVGAEAGADEAKEQ